MPAACKCSCEKRAARTPRIRPTHSRRVGFESLILSRPRRHGDDLSPSGAPRSAILRQVSNSASASFKCPNSLFMRGIYSIAEMRSRCEKGKLASVPAVGIEPTLPKEHDFESCASTNSATPAYARSRKVGIIVARSRISSAERSTCKKKICGAA